MGGPGTGAALSQEAESVLPCLIDHHVLRGLGDTSREAQEWGWSCPLRNMCWLLAQPVATFLPHGVTKCETFPIQSFVSCLFYWILRIQGIFPCQVIGVFFTHSWGYLGLYWMGTPSFTFTLSLSHHLCGFQCVGVAHHSIVITFCISIPMYALINVGKLDQRMNSHLDIPSIGYNT